jgi:hypothetical protein
LLDFLLTGFARSGTTALADLLSNFPSVYCGQERFDICSIINNFDNLSLGSFTDSSLAGNTHDVNRLKLKLGENAPIKLLGDKQPLLVSLPDILNQDDVPVFFIYRCATGVVRSWDERSNDPCDEHWPRSKSGIHFFTELLIFLTLAKFENLSYISYDNLCISRHHSEWGFVKKFPFNAAYDPSIFNSNYKSMRVVNAFEQERYKQLYNYLGLAEFESTFISAKAEHRSTLFRELRNYLRRNFKRITDLHTKKMTSDEWMEIDRYESYLMNGSVKYAAAKKENPALGLFEFLEKAIYL